MKWYKASKLGYYYNKMSLTNHVYIVIYLLLFSFLITNIQSITPSSVDSIHPTFPLDLTDENNYYHFLYNAGYCSKYPQDDIIYAKYNLVYKRARLVDDSIEKCGYSSSSHFPEIFQYRTNVIETKLIKKLLDDKYEYIINIGLCLGTDGPAGGNGGGDNNKLHFDYPNLKCHITRVNNTIGYVTIKLERDNSDSSFKASCDGGGGGNNNNLVADNSLLQIKLASDKKYFSNFIETVRVSKPNPPNQSNYNFPRTLSGNRTGCNDVNDFCLSGYFCNGKQCSPCAALCNECISSYTNKCMSCKALSDVSANKGDCQLNYVDIIKYDDISVQIAPPRSNRVTIGYWVFINKLSELNKKPVHVYLQDFMVLSFQPSSSNNKIILTCVVHERYNKNLITEQSVSTSNIPESDYIEWEQIITDNKWFYVQCGMSYIHKQFYLKSSINDKVFSEEKKIEYIKLSNTGSGILNDESFFKVYYKPGESIPLKIINGSKLSSSSTLSVYIRYVNVFGEFVPKEINYHNYNVYKIAKQTRIPELLFALPLDLVSLPYSTTPYVEGINFTPEKTTTVRSYLIKKDTFSYEAPLSFKRLVLLDANQEYITENATQYMSIPTQNALYDDKGDNANVYLCKDRGDLIQNYLKEVSATPGPTTTISVFKCNPSGCNTTHSVFPLTYEQGHICFELNPQSIQCTHYYFNYCLTKEHYIYFSQLFPSGTIYFPLTKNPPYRSYIIDFWLHPDNTLFLSENLIDETNEVYLFYSNSVRLYKKDGKYYAYAQDASEHIEITIDDGWNWFIFNIIYLNGIYTAELIINDDFDDVKQLGIIQTELSLEYIVFSHNDPKHLLDNGKDAIQWHSAFYKHLRIWDGTKIQPKAVSTYFNLYTESETYLDSMILHLPFTVNSMDGNVFVDKTRNKRYPIENVIKEANIEAINFSHNFQKEYTNCDNATTHCNRCWLRQTPDSTTSSTITDIYCFECENDYTLQSGKCINTGDTFYSNPNNQRTPVKLNYLDFLRGTITFWVKPYGFDSSPCDIIFYGRNLKLEYNADYNDKNFGLSLRYKAGNSEWEVMTLSPTFRMNIGKWTYISLAYWTETTVSGALNYFPPMMNFEINNESFGVGRKLVIGDIPNNIIINQFELKQSFFCLFAYLTYYNQYIVGSLSVKHLINLSPSFYLQTFKQGTSPNNCLGGDSFQLQQFEYTCVFDDTFPYLADAGWYYNFAENINKTCPTECIECFGDDSTLCSCDTFKTNRDYMLLRDMTYNYCQRLEFINMASTSETKIDLTTPSSPPPTGSTLTHKYTLQLWAWANDYISGNFLGFSVYWENHNKIEVNYVSGSYVFECHPTDENDSIKTELPFTKGQWNYLSCSIDFDQQLYYTQTLSRKIERGIGIIIPSSKLTDTTYSLTIIDKNNEIEWGTLLLKQIRLWNRVFTDAIPMSKTIVTCNIDYILHIFNMNYNEVDKDSNGTKEIVITDECSSNVVVPIIYKPLYGYNIVNDGTYQESLLCSSFGSYYQQQPEKCITFIDINNINLLEPETNKFINEIDFQNVNVSPTGSYSMAFWIFISDVNTLNSIEFIFDMHLKVEVKKDNANIKAFCYPQLYFKEEYYKTHNVQNVKLSVTGGEWFWIMCSVSNMDMMFSINGNDFVLEPEMLYSDTINDYPLRYFFLDTTGNGATENFHIKLNHPQTTPSASAIIYLRSLYLFNDYIPYDYNIKYTDLTKIPNHEVKELLFAINFDQMKPSSPDATTTTSTTSDYSYKIYYYLFNNGIKTANDITVTLKHNAEYILSANFQFVPLCEINERIGDNKFCEPISTCVLNEVNAKLGCTDDKFPLTCDNNYYMNVDSITKTNTCESGCNFNMYRLPGGNNAMCSTKCPENSICPNKGNNELVDLQNQFNCMNGFSRINYKCLNDNEDQHSAFYFGKCYNQPNVVMNLDAECQYSNNNMYYFEFWVMIDFSNFKTCLTTKTFSTTGSKYYLLYTVPHRIYLSSDGSYYYEYKEENNLQKSGGFSLNKYEWNRIIIFANENKVTIYLNYDETPLINEFSPSTSSIIPVSKILFCNDNTDCDGFAVGDEWLSAYYKEFRIWDKTTTLNLIRSFGSKLFTRATKSLIQYWPFTFKYIDSNVIKNGIRSQCDISLTFNTGATLSYNDRIILYNYSTKFDWGITHPNEYITSINDSTKQIISASCPEGCSRCYKKSSTDTNTICYECTIGYILGDKVCNKITAFFLKLPLDSGNQLDLKTKTTAGFDLANQKGVTLTFYMKFFGNINGHTKKYPEILTLSSSLKLCYNYTDSELVLSLNDEKLFVDDKFPNDIGIWVPIAIANYVGGSNSGVYPSMITFNVNRRDIPINLGEFPTQGIAFTQIIFGYEIAALVADIRLYDRMIHGAYGRITAGDLTRDVNLVHNIKLYNTLSPECIAENDLGASQNIDTIECVGDYNHYLENKCDNDLEYYEPEPTPHCATCDGCVKNCYGGDVKSCTCDLTEGFYWLKRDDTFHSYCDKIGLVDFSTLTAITVDQVKASLTKESTLEFWVYVSEYVSKTHAFTQFNVEWNKHNKITVEKYADENKIIFTCYPLVDVSDYSLYIQNIKSTPVTTNEWVYVQCGTNLITGEAFMRITQATDNEKYDATLDISLTVTRSDTTKLLIYNNINSLNSYGYVLVQHIKMWQHYNKAYIYTYHIDFMSPDIYTDFTGLIGFFENKFETEMLIEEKITHKYISISRRTDYIGYNYVSYNDDENIYCVHSKELNAGNCNALSSPKNACKYQNKNNCVLCNNGLFLSTAQACVTDCGNGLYPNNVIMQCRLCYKTCSTCINGNENGCTKCNPGYYLIKDLNDDGTEKTNGVCVVSCEEQGLIPQTDGTYGGICTSFAVSVRLVKPTPDKPIDLKSFREIEAALVGTTTGALTYEWSFDESKTREINNNDSGLSLGASGPFGSNKLNGLIVKVNKNFFQAGYKYVFCFSLSPREHQGITIRHYFTLTINKPPYNGIFNIIPPVGLRATTAFILHCSNWEDDNTPPEKLSYRFTYNETNVGMTVIQDWSNENEISTRINVKNYQVPSTDVIISCQIKDVYDEITEVNINTRISNDLSNGIYTLDGALDKYVLPDDLLNDKALLIRSELLKSLSVDPDKQIKPLYTQTKFTPSLDQTAIEMLDPECTTSYCNSYGTCMLVDTLLACSCKTGHIGFNCQVDINGMVPLQKNYETLFKIVIEVIYNYTINNNPGGNAGGSGDDSTNSGDSSDSGSGTNSGDSSSSGDDTTTDSGDSSSVYVAKEKILMLSNLFEGASYFYEDSSFFTKNIPTLIQLFKLPEMIDYFINEFDLLLKAYGCYYDFLIRKIATEKAMLKESMGSDERIVEILEDSITKYKIELKTLRNNLKSLIDYLISTTPSLTNNNDLYYIYESKSLYIQITQLTSSTTDNDIFEDRKSSYKTHLEFMNCIRRYISSDPSIQIYFAFIDYINTPLLYNSTLYINNTSPLVEVLFYKNGQPFEVECPVNDDNDNDDNYNLFKIHFPFTSFTWIDELNAQKPLYNPSNYKSGNDDIFKDPIYIEPSGYVSNETIEVRIQKYHRRHNITCNYDNTITNNANIEDTNDYVDYTFSNKGMKYYNLSESSYIICTSTHASLFTTYYIDNDITFNTAGRFFYVQRPQIFKYYPNYIDNIGFWICVFFLLLYIILVLIVNCLDQKHFRHKGMLEFLKMEIIRNHFPYNKPDSKEIMKLMPNAFKKYDEQSNKPFIGGGASGSSGSGNTNIPKMFKHTNDNKIIEDINEDNNDTGNNDFIVIKEKSFYSNDDNTNNNNTVGDNDNEHVASFESANPPKRKGNGRRINKYPGTSIDNITSVRKTLFSSDERSDTPSSSSHNKIRIQYSTINANASTINQNYGFINTNDLNTKPVFITHDKPVVFNYPQLGEDDNNNNIQPNTKQSTFHSQNRDKYGLLAFTSCEFLCWNIKERHKVFNIFNQITVFHPRWKKITLLYTELTLIMLFNTIQLTLEENIIVTNNIFGTVRVILISVYASALLMYPLSLFFVTPNESKDKLFKLTAQGKDLQILKEYNELNRRVRCISIIGMILHMCIWLISFYISFGFVTVWAQQRMTWCACTVIGFVFMHTVCELLMEMLIMFIYACRKKGRCILCFGYYLNELRTNRVLWP